MSDEAPVVPATVMTISPSLEASVSASLSARGPSSPASDEVTFQAFEQVYAAEGETPFDPLNSADMLVRAFVLSEASTARQ